MTIIQRYIAKSVLAATAFVILIILGISFIINLLSELRDVGSGDYGFKEAVFHVFLLMPYILYQFFPMIIMLGSVIGLGMFLSYQELIVMRTSGVSTRKILLYVMSASLLLIILGTAIGELIAPQAYFLADTRKSSAQNGGQAVATASGVWIHEKNNFLHINRVIGPKHLEGVTRYQFDDNHRLLASYYAQSMDFESGQWLLHNLAKTTLSQDHTNISRFKKTTWDLTMNPSLINVGLIEPEEMSLGRLHHYSKHLMQNGLLATNFQFEFWKRIFEPLASIIMILLAVPFVLGSPRSVNVGWRILFSVMIGFGFFILNNFLGQLSILFQLSPLLAAILPIFLFGVAGYVLIWRQRGY